MSLSRSQTPRIHICLITKPLAFNCKFTQNAERVWDSMDKAKKDREKLWETAPCEQLVFVKQWTCYYKVCETFKGNYTFPKSTLGMPIVAVRFASLSDLGVPHNVYVPSNTIYFCAFHSGPVWTGCSYSGPSYFYEQQHTYSQRKNDRKIIWNSHLRCASTISSCHFVVNKWITVLRSLRFDTGVAVVTFRWMQRIRSLRRYFRLYCLSCRRRGKLDFIPRSLQFLFEIFLELIEIAKMFAVWLLLQITLIDFSIFLSNHRFMSIVAALILSPRKYIRWKFLGSWLNCSHTLFLKSKIITLCNLQIKSWMR